MAVGLCSPAVADIVTTLRELRPESAAASTLRLDLGGATLDYRPGQYIMIDPHQFEELGPEIREREAQRGKTMGPGYFSLSSDGTDPKLIEITVKLGPDGAPGMLPAFLLKKMEPGRAIRIQGPGGKYHLPEEPPPGITGFLHLCAGSAVAPNRGMIRHALAKKWPQRQLLILQDRSESDHLFHKEFEDLARHHPEFRFRQVHSRSKQELLTAELIRTEAAGFLDLAASWAFICGPNHPRPQGPGFVDRLRGALSATLGFTPDRIRTE
jgi:ferredoxin-NADP reductase